MNPIEDLQGIITVLNTPFDSYGNIDFFSLEKNVKYALDAGVRGFLIPAMAAEVGKLNEKEKIDMVRCATSVCGSEAAVIGGTSAPNLEGMYRLGEMNLEAGCQGILANIPYTGDEEYSCTIEKLDSLSPGFLMLQDWDSSGYGLPPALIQELFRRIESFKCLKIETVPAGVKYSQILELTKGKLHLSGGWAVSQMLEGLRRGIHAFMPTGMHRIYCIIFRLYKENRQKEARELFERLQPILAFSNQHLDISIHFFKRLLWKQGVYSTPLVREPILPFDSVHKEEADYLISRVIELENSLS